MKKTFRYAAAMLCTVLTAASLAGCKSTEEDGTIKQKDLPYGATITIKNNFAIKIQYDERFLSQELVARVVEYYQSIQDRDAEKYAGVLFPMYHDYLLNTVSGGQSNNQEYVNNEYDNFKKTLGKAFDFSYLEISNAGRGKQYKDSAALLNSLDDIAKESGKSAVSDKIDDIYELKMTCYLTEDQSGVRTETGCSLEDLSLFALHCDGKWYLIED